MFIYIYIHLYLYIYIYIYKYEGSTLQWLAPRYPRSSCCFGSPKRRAGRSASKLSSAAAAAGGRRRTRRDARPGTVVFLQSSPAKMWGLHGGLYIYIYLHTHVCVWLYLSFYLNIKYIYRYIHVCVCALYEMGVFMRLGREMKIWQILNSKNMELTGTRKVGVLLATKSGFCIV